MFDYDLDYPQNHASANVMKQGTHAVLAGKLVSRSLGAHRPDLVPVLFTLWDIQQNRHFSNTPWFASAFDYSMLG